MGEFGTIIQWAVAAIAIIAGGAATTLLTVVRTLRESNNDLRRRVTDLEDDRDDLRVKLTERDDAVAQTRRDMDALAKVITGEAHLVALEQRLEEHHKQAMGGVERILKALAKLADLLRGGR